MILLDTCSLLWLASDQKKLSAKAKKAIKANAGGLFVSSISAFEISIKKKKGKLKLPFLASKWFEEVLEFHGIDEIPIDSQTALRSVALPAIHSDPCDRFIIATSLEHSLSILTIDPLIKQYKQAKVIW